MRSATPAGLPFPHGTNVPHTEQYPFVYACPVHLGFGHSTVAEYPFALFTLLTPVHHSTYTRSLSRCAAASSRGGDSALPASTRANRLQLASRTTHRNTARLSTLVLGFSIRTRSLRISLSFLSFPADRSHQRRLAWLAANVAPVAQSPYVHRPATYPTPQFQLRSLCSLVTSRIANNLLQGTRYRSTLSSSVAGHEYSSAQHRHGYNASGIVFLTPPSRTASARRSHRATVSHAAPARRWRGSEKLDLGHLFLGGPTNILCSAVGSRWGGG